MVAIEVEQVLNDLYPLLRAVQPAEINKTLNALATALEGRGDQLGENIETLDAYLKRINPQIPALVEDLRLTSEVVRQLRRRDAARSPRSCDDTVADHRHTLEGREEKLHDALRRRVRASPTPRRDVPRPRTATTSSGSASSAPQQLRVFAKYAPEYPCLTRGIVNAGKLQAEAFRGFTLHIVLETLPNQPRAYDAAATSPGFGDNRGPYCLHLPNPPWNQTNPRPPPAELRRRRRRADRARAPAGSACPGAELRGSAAGSPEETALLRSAARRLRSA